MVEPKLMGALSYRASLARKGTTSSQFPTIKHTPDPDEYFEKGQVCGGVPLIILAGDFMQLAPLGSPWLPEKDKKIRERRLKLAKEDGLSTRSSLLVPVEDAAGCAEHKNGLRLFHNAVTDVHILTQTFRFRDAITNEPCPVLPRLLAYMRVPDGEPLPSDLWEELQKCVVESKDDPRLQLPRIKEAYQAAVLSLISMHVNAFHLLI